MPDFIPRKDSLAVAWGENFSQGIAAEAARLNIPVATVDELTSRQAAFADALLATGAPISRTSVTIEAKRAARSAFERIARSVAGMVRAQLLRDRETLILLGLATGPGRDAPRRRIGRPTSAPRVTIRDVNGSRVTIQLQNIETPGRRGMHPDTVSAHLYTFVGEQCPAEASEWKHAGGTSRTITTIDFGPSHRPGTQVWIRARWLDAKANASPESAPVMTFLGYCGAAHAA